MDQQANDSALRKTGIRFATELPWGAHLCVFYETKDDLLDVLAGYFMAGLEGNELCVWAISDPVTEEYAKGYLRRTIPEFDRYLSVGQFEIFHGYEWYLKGDQFELKRITDGWSEKLSGALAKGYEGVRASGNALWSGTDHWNEFCEYEYELDRLLSSQKMIVLCTYSLQACRAGDILDVARAHQFSLAKRNGRYELLETPELKQAKQEITTLNAALENLSKRNPTKASLTQRERMVLAQIMRGASSKEAARILGVCPRTIEFHRANVMQKLSVKNTVDLVRRVLGAKSDAHPYSKTWQ
jgi:DNA-binding CsgD family transcriptional regulator